LQLAIEQWSSLEQAQLMRLHMARGCLLYTRGGCALAVLRKGKGSGAQERASVLGDAKRLRATDVPHAAAWAAVLEGGLAIEQRKLELASQRLRSAVDGFEAAGLRLYAAAARRRLGQLIGGSEGQALLVHAEVDMTAEGVSDLEATSEMLTPGCRS
jgi:eukaryotic-like serine/threonine-protein kinase